MSDDMPDWLDDYENDIYEWESDVMERARKNDPAIMAKQKRIDDYYESQESSTDSHEEFLAKTHSERLMDKIARWCAMAYDIEGEAAEERAHDWLRGNVLMAEAMRLDDEALEDWR